MKPGDTIKFEVESPYIGIIPRSVYTGILREFTTKIIKVEFPQPSIALDPEETFKWVDITKLELMK